MSDNQWMESVRAQGQECEGAAIWRALAAEAQHRPWMWRLLTTRGAELLESIVANYQTLLALSRQRRRGLMRKAGMGLAGVALLVSLNAGTALAGTITVTGACTLTEAITAANTDAPTANCPAGSGDDTIVLTGDVTLTANYATPATGPFYYANGLPRITSTVTIEGNNHTISRVAADPNDKFRILDVQAGGNLTLNDTTITGGDVTPPAFSDAGGGIQVHSSALTLNNSVISYNTANFSGGIHSSNDSTLTINSSQIISNTAAYEAGGLTIESGSVSDSTVSGNVVNGNPGSKGGGLFVPSIGIVPKIVTINNSTVSDNTSTGRGGGMNLYDANAHVTVSNSTISGNEGGSSGSGLGGGIYSTSYLTVTNSTVSNNQAYYAGGVDLATSLTTIVNSTISGNTAQASGGGIRNNSLGLTVNNSTISGNTATSLRGGGLYNTYIATISNSTLSGNTGYYGGGLNNYGGTLKVYSSTITYNHATNMYGGVANNSDLTMKHSIVSGNTASIAVNEAYDASGGSFLGAYNLFGHSGENNTQAFLGFTPGLSDINATTDGTPVALGSILDTALSNNGGPTLTHALVSGSPAIDAIPSGYRRSAAASPALCTPGASYDQRGVFRGNSPTTNTGTACDIGAFEFGASPTAVTIASFSSQTAWGSGPQLVWETGSESGLSGFHIWRGTADAAETRLTDALIGAAGGLNGSEYAWQDSVTFGWGQRSWYWLEAMNADGSSSFTGPVEVLGLGKIFLPVTAR